MPKFLGIAFWISDTKKSTHHSWTLFSDFRLGFSLIELMVVISLFGIATSLITASYLSFEKAQRVKGAALQVKNDLRLVQNKATSGDNGITASGSFCRTDDQYHHLGGWFLNINSTAGSNSTYTLGGNCYSSPGSSDCPGPAHCEVSFNVKIVNLPKDVVIANISYGGLGSVTPASLMFRPLAVSPSIHNTLAIGPPIAYFDDTYNLINLVNPPQPQLPVSINFANTGGTINYYLKVLNTGEINESATP